MCLLVCLQRVYMCCSPDLRLISLWFLCVTRSPIRSNIPFEPPPLEPTTHSVAKNSGDHQKICRNLRCTASPTPRLRGYVWGLRGYVWGLRGYVWGLRGYVWGLRGYVWGLRGYVWGLAAWRTIAAWQTQGEREEEHVAPAVVERNRRAGDMPRLVPPCPCQG